MTPLVSYQATEKTVNYSVSNTKKPILVKSDSVAKAKEKAQNNSYTFVGIAG